MGPRRWCRGMDGEGLPGERKLIASMGPRRWCRGMGLMKAQMVLSVIASMGPRRWCRGMGGSSRSGQRPSYSASMGPRQWSRGKGRGARVTGRWIACFNGATTMVSWNGFAEAGSGINASLQWGHDDGVVDWARAGHDDWDQRKASMGPRRWCRGMASTPRPVKLTPLARFNGATTMVSWNGHGTAQATSTLSLQWGHDDGVVEWTP